MSRNAFREAVARYWDLAYREGCEGREVDTPEGDAQSTLSEIMRLYDERSADQPDAARLKESAENFNSPGAVKACRHPVFTSWETATTGGKTCAHCGEKFDLLDLRAADQQPAAHYPVEWGPSDARQLTCACGNPDPAHADQQSSALTQGEQDTFWNALLHQGPPDKPSA
jgi:hypothetical protein